MRSTKFLLPAMLVVAAGSALAPSAMAKKAPPPKFGDYRGHTKPAAGRTDENSPLFRFIIKKGKSGKPPKITTVDASLPMSCSGDAFDLPFGDVAKPPYPAKASGKIPAVVGEVFLPDLVTKGLLGTAPAAHVKGQFSGKITGKKAKGTYEVTQTDGSSCSGKGTWNAKLFT